MSEAKCHWCDEGRPFIPGQEGVQHVPLYAGGEHSGAMCYCSSIYEVGELKIPEDLKYRHRFLIEGVAHSSRFGSNAILDGDVARDIAIAKRELGYIERIAALRAILLRIAAEAGTPLSDLSTDEFLAELPNELRMQREKLAEKEG